MILNLNGNPPFPPIQQKPVLIGHYSFKTTSVAQPCTSLVSTSGWKVGLFPHARLQQMPQTPTMIIVTIAATRIYRSLISFGPFEMYGGVTPYHFSDKADYG